MDCNQETNELVTSSESLVLKTSQHARWCLATFTVVGSVLGIGIYCVNLAAGDWNIAEIVALPLFVVLFSWIVFSFGVSTCGFFLALRSRSSSRVPLLPESQGQTAVLVPIYNESPDDVFARVAAMVRSLCEQDQRLGCARAAEFHFYVLSDSTDPEVWLAEELAWARLNQQLTSGDQNRMPQVYYRHRSKNVARKAGNIADFCERWSAPYDYMIVLDADSLLAPETMVAMVDAMAADSRLGILQVPPTPIGRESFFARLQQFSAAAYGQISCRGFDAWAGNQGNYWGHNAILRVSAFCESCDLPVLPGKGPLGGEILSHDFVEAALMVRDRWKVRLANDVGGSYEECPTTLTDYAMRDQRWCQGNLQHGSLMLCEGYHLASRLHFFSGVLAYIASPIWLLWSVLAVLGWVLEPATPRAGIPPWVPSQFALFAIAMLLLLLPKFYGLVAIIVQGRSGQFGGVARLFLSAALETGMSILLSPVMAVLHSRFVFNTLLGRKVLWNAQNRSEQGVSFSSALSDYGLFSLLGAIITWSVFNWATPLAWWFAPLVAGLLLTVPLAMLLGSKYVGLMLSRFKLLRIPEESVQPQVSRRYKEFLAAYEANQTAEDAPQFERLLQYPSFYLLHDRVLNASDSDVPLSQAERDRILRIANEGIAGIPRDLRRAILSDRQLLRELHVIAQMHKSPVTA